MLIYFRKWVILVCISVVMSLRLLEPLFTVSAEQNLLVIGVLSAQNNFAARASIRKTWKTLVNPNHKFFFIVGSQFCPIHPADRKSELTCESLHLAPILDQQNANPLWTPEASTKNLTTTGATVTAFTFRVNFPVVVRGFRVWKGLFERSSLLTITLKNARTGTVVLSENFPHSAPTDTPWVVVQTKPLVLSKSFDAELQLLADQSIESCYGQSSWFNFSEAVEFTTLYKVGTGWSNFDEETCSPMSVDLQLHDLETFLPEKERRMLQWNWQVESMSKRLSNEVYTEQDILFVDVLDVYRNIPDKLLSFYAWVYENLKFSFLLKADDDTFLNIPTVENYLKSVHLIGEKKNYSSELWWWGRLRHGLPVERHGKWQELHYAAPVYPPFLCGGGYVLNKNAVQFLVTNSRWLHRFQGEDTSLGIWLSGAHPRSPKHAPCHWVCGDECGKHSCNRGQLSPGDMLTVWHKFQETQCVC